MLLNHLSLLAAKFAAKTNGARPELEGVFITKDRVAATDSFRLIEITVPKDVDVKRYPGVQGKSPMFGFKPFIISATDLKSVNLPTGKSRNPIKELDCVAVARVEPHIELLTADNGIGQVKVARRIEGRFPDYEKIFPTVKPMAKVSVNGEALAEMLEVASKFNNLKAVEIEFYANGLPLLIKAKGENQELRSLLMPLKT